MLRTFWADDAGFIVSIELLFIAVILVIGLVAGWSNLRTAIAEQFTELGNAIQALNPGYAIDGLAGASGSSAGSAAKVQALAPLELAPVEDLAP